MLGLIRRGMEEEPMLIMIADDLAHTNTHIKLYMMWFTLIHLLHHQQL